ncbi:hypothetical protein N7462_010117 [Penicillium macrosclerotiorum]|uniref:uncharacterized protein n=1 Tax=Penicillium macrosclerotiorum TaxID=303699 RepID=UPI0025466F10|nr:uncharacterized protein N7462_010117 [Penicillium macrosclerotiorum]KAJ5669047.1 hypothetical protein N7462_010117 [Penicillium macrosclerotiorum]
MPSPAKTPILPHSLPLTLIVATTPIRVASPAANEPPTRLGIGLKGTLPWPRIKTDMSFFARATSRSPAPGTTNAIIMGRKTYDSVPPHLRPLGKRISVVVTRDTTGTVRDGVLQELAARKAKMAAKSADEPEADALVAGSLDAALAELDSTYGAAGRLGKVFVIGGAEIYGAALRMQQVVRPVRIVMTNVVRKAEGEGEAREFECDTFFPVEKLTAKDGWRTASPEELSEWVGESVSGEWIREGDVEVQMVGYERVSS